MSFHHPSQKAHFPQYPSNASQWVWMSLNETEWVWMSLNEPEWAWRSLNEPEWVSVSLRACQRMVRIEKFCYMIEIVDTAVNIVRNCIPMRNCMLRELLWSESHFRLVNYLKFFSKMTRSKAKLPVIQISNPISSKLWKFFF